MNAHTIRPIALCQGPRDKSYIAYFMPPGTTTNTASYVWLIEGGPLKILVDAGATAEAFQKRGASETDIVSVRDGLNKFGVTPEEIDMVIFTHLHWDHTMLSHLYTRARFVVQQIELDYARNPHPLDARFYNRATFEKLPFETVDGDVEIVPGMRLLLTPGHTRGGQSIEVDTAAGKAIIPSFCGTMDNFRPSKEFEPFGWEVVPPVIHGDIHEVYENMVKIKRRADIILTLHGPDLIGRDRVP